MPKPIAQSLIALAALRVSAIIEQARFHAQKLTHFLIDLLTHSLSTLSNCAKPSRARRNHGPSIALRHEASFDPHAARQESQPARQATGWGLGPSLIIAVGDRFQAGDDLVVEPFMHILVGHAQRVADGAVVGASVAD